MISRLFRPIKEGFRGVFRHGAMSVSASSAVTITLLIISLFLIFTTNVRQFTTGVEQSVQISVMVDWDYETAENEDRISLAISEIPGVSKVTFSSKDDELQYYLDEFTDEATRQLFAPFQEEGSNPMHDAFYVEVSDGEQISAIAERISTIEGVSKVNFGGSSVISLIAMLRAIRNGGVILAIALSILAIYLVHNTIKLTIMARADEIAIMRNVGAKNGFIRSPFVVEGMLIGAIGAIIPIVLTYFGYTYLYDFTGGYIISNMFTLIEPAGYVQFLMVTLLVIGMIVGLIGSSSSVSKYLRWKR